jgi:alkylation response protein AidB-like acyl-CoA dehydrogenase
MTPDAFEDNRAVAVLNFSACNMNAGVTVQALTGSKGDGLRQMLSTLDRGKIGIAAMGGSCAQGAYEKALTRQRAQAIRQGPRAFSRSRSRWPTCA